MHFTTPCGIVSLSSLVSRLSSLVSRPIPRRNLGSTVTRTMGVKRFIAASPGASPEIRLASSGRAITVTKEVSSQF
jgi:hypothetical protein